MQTLGTKRMLAPDCDVLASNDIIGSVLSGSVLTNNKVISFQRKVQIKYKVFGAETHSVYPRCLSDDQYHAPQGPKTHPNSPSLQMSCYGIYISLPV